ncbi:MAG: hypothetical protein ACYC4R_04715 [Anaerolineae bacterium]
MPVSCPGAKTVKEPRPGYVRCPHCRTEVEIWSDEIRARCEGCHAWVYTERGASCLDWCAKARECVGASAYEAYQRAKERP